MSEDGVQTSDGAAAPEDPRLRERRGYARVGGHMLVALRPMGDDEARVTSGALTSLSLGGARVRCPVDVPQGTRVAMDLPIPSMLEPCSAMARVVSHAPCGQPGLHELCVEFIEMSAQHRARVADYIAARLESERDSQHSLQMKIEVLQDLAHVFHSTMDVDRVLEAVVDIARELTGAESGSLWLQEGDEKGVWARVVRGRMGERAAGILVPAGEGVAGWVAQHRRSLKLDRADEKEDWVAETTAEVGYAARSLVAVPLKLKDHCIGVLKVMNGPERPPFDVDSVRVVEAVAGQAATIIENARLYARSQREASLSRARLLEAWTEADLWHRAAESNLDLVAAVYLPDQSALLLSEAARRLCDTLGAEAEPVLARLHRVLEEASTSMEHTEHVRSSHLLAAEDCTEPVLLAQVSPLAGADGRMRAVIAHLVDLRA